MDAGDIGANPPASVEVGAQFRALIALPYHKGTEIEMPVQQVSFMVHLVVIAHMIGSVKASDHLETAVDVLLFDQFDQCRSCGDSLGKEGFGLIKSEFVNQGGEAQLDVAAANPAVSAARPFARPHSIKDNDTTPRPRQRERRGYSGKPGPNDPHIRGAGNSSRIGDRA